MIRRREFMALLGGAAVTWPVAARAHQQSERMRRIGVLMHTPADEPESQARLAAFMQGLQESGWAVGRNLRIDYRWSVGDSARLYKDAAELVALAPEVILGGVGATAAALQQASRTVPVVMAQGIDPVGNGYVESLAQPGGNITGFIQFEYSLAGKWMELLKEVAPGITRVGVLREPGNAAIGQWAMIQAMAQSFGAELRRIDLREASEIERSVTAFARSPDGGLIVAVSAASLTHRDLIIRLAAQHRLPAVYAYRVFVTHGGLITYGPDIVSQYRSRRLRRSHPQGREASRPAGAGSDQVRVGDQPQDREGSWPRNPPDTASPRRRGDRMRRREFIAGLRCDGWPVRAHAQQPAMPIVGFVTNRSAEASVRQAAAFRKGLNETGYVEGQSVIVEYHWLDGQYDRLPALMADLERRRVAVIATFANAPALGQSCDHDDPDRLRRRPRSGEDGSCCKPCAAGRQCDRYQLFQPGGRRQAAGTLARPSAQGRSDCRTGQSDQSLGYRRRITRDTGSGTRPRTANCGPQRQHQPRDRGGLQHPRGRPGRRALRRP